jgi:hypothetical protein
LGNKLFDIGKLGIPTFPNTGPSQPPFYLRTPSRSNFDVSFFKNFNISESKKIQFRTGLFNVFNQAYPSSTNVTATNLGGVTFFSRSTPYALKPSAVLQTELAGPLMGLSAIRPVDSVTRNGSGPWVDANGNARTRIGATRFRISARSLICTAAEL